MNINNHTTRKKTRFSWKPNQLFSIGVLILVAAFVPVTLLLLSQQQTLKQQASETDSSQVGGEPMPVQYMYSLRGRVFVDTNQNGIFDTEQESMLQNIMVSVSGEDEVLTDLTSSEGEYMVPVLGGKTYAVFLTLPKGYDTATNIINVTVDDALQPVDFPVRKMTSATQK